MHIPLPYLFNNRNINQMNKRLIFYSLFIFLSLTVFAQSEESDNEEFKKKKVAERLYNEGISKILVQDYYSALFYLDSVIAIKPDFAIAYNERGKIYFTKERYNDAIMEFEKASDLNAEFGEAWFNLAYTYFTKDSVFIYNDSLTITSADFDKAINAGYAKPHAYYYRGLMKHLEGNLDNAIADYSVAIELNSEYAKAYHDRGTAKNSIGDFQGAVYDYRMAVTYNPVLTEGYINMGDAKRQIGDYQGAERDYTVAINIDSTDYMAYNNRGGARHVMGNLDGATEDFSKAYKLNPESIEVISNMGSLEQNKGNLEAAIDWFNEALNMDENYAPAILNRGLTFELQGELDAACADWKRALELGLEEAGEYYKECQE